MSTESVFLGKASLTTFTEEMKFIRIRDIEIRHYRFPFNPPFRPAWDHQTRSSLTSTIVRVHTDDGRVGVGSGDSMLGFDQFKHLFIGEEVLQMERHQQVLDTLSFHHARYWPLDIALWDLMGQKAGMPLYQLFGGATNRVPAYCSTGELHDAKARRDEVRALCDQGFQAVKIRAHHSNFRDDLEVVQAVRDELGEQMQIMVDVNQGWRMPGDTRPYWDYKTAFQFAKELENYDVYWLEEPLHREDYAGLARLRESTSVRIAAGELNRHVSDFREYAKYGSVDVIQPDVVVCGGLSQGLKIASLAWHHGMQYSPHTWGDGIGLIANLHLAAGTGLCPYVEFPFDPPGMTNERRDFMLKTPTVIDEVGYLRLTDAPGLGIELHPDLERFELQL